MAGRGRKIFTQERAAIADVQDFLMDQTVMVFASASARGAAIPSPSEGMTSKLLDSGRIEDFISGGWRPRNGVVRGNNAAGSLSLTNNVNLIDLTVNPGRPYRVRVTAEVGVTPSGTTPKGSLRIFNNSVRRAAFDMNDKVTTGLVSRTFDVTDGSSQLYRINLEVTGGTFTYYADDTFSYAEATWWAL